jgi:two-component system, OmpR family, response regulator
MKILLVDDERQFSALTQEYLEAKNCKVTLCHSGDEGLEAFKKDTFDCCILDIKMPMKDGFTLASDIRGLNPEMPLVFLTGAAQKEERIKGLSLGADDYITKPFSLEELYLRLQNILKRVGNQRKAMAAQPIFSIGNYSFDANARTLSLNTQQEKLTAMEAKLLQLFLEDERRIIHRDVALRRIWGDDDQLKGRSLNVYVSKLRQFLAGDPRIEILNVHGEGYQLVIK